MFPSQKSSSESRELVGEAGFLSPDILSEAHPGAPCPAAVAGLVPLGPVEILGELLVVIQRDVEAVQAHVLLPGVPLALDVEGGVPVVDVVQLVILLGHVFRLPGLGWFSGRAGGELGESPLMENWTNFSSGTSESAVMRAATGFLFVSGWGSLWGS